MTQSFVTCLLKIFFRSEKYLERKKPMTQSFVTWLLKNIFQKILSEKLLERTK
jgi:ATP-dependent Clp protease adapter protein ClpS